MHALLRKPLAVGLGLSLSLLAAPITQAANHREAPLTALDHKADIADWFAFVSYDNPNKVTLIMTVNPLLEPSNGPNYFPFDPEITYAIHVDNDFDAEDDVSFEFKFQTEIRAPGVFTGFVGAGGGIVAPPSSPPPIVPGTLIVPPAITALDGPGSEGFSERQHYTVTKVKGHGPNAHRTVLASGLIAVPSNVGPRTMPDYPALADQGIYDIGNGIKVFAGTVEDPFYIDLGAAFDSLNFRPSGFGTGVPGVFSDTQDADDQNNYTPDDVAGFNVNAIAIEVPIKLLTQDGHLHAADDPLATIGTYATTSRPKLKIYSQQPGGLAVTSSALTQIQRMGNPLFNELIIGTGSKDKFSMSAPKDDAQFADFALDPLLARVLNAVYNLPIPTPPRNDLLPLVQYLPPIAAAGTPPGPVADLLRLNTGIGPTAAGQRSRLAFLTLLDGNTSNDDPAGFPNGRRVSDDVTDIASRAVAGVLAGGAFSGFPYNRIGDGANSNDATYRESLPLCGLRPFGSRRPSRRPQRAGLHRHLSDELIAACVRRRQECRRRRLRGQAHAPVATGTMGRFTVKALFLALLALGAGTAQAAIVDPAGSVSWQRRLRSRQRQLRSGRHSRPSATRRPSSAFTRPTLSGPPKTAPSPPAPKCKAAAVPAPPPTAARSSDRRASTCLSKASFSRSAMPSPARRSTSP